MAPNTHPGDAVETGPTGPDTGTSVVAGTTGEAGTGVGTGTGTGTGTGVGTNTGTGTGVGTNTGTGTVGAAAGAGVFECACDGRTGHFVTKLLGPPPIAGGVNAFAAPRFRTGCTCGDGAGWVLPGALVCTDFAALAGGDGGGDFGGASLAAAGWG